MLNFIKKNKKSIVYLPLCLLTSSVHCLEGPFLSIKSNMGHNIILRYFKIEEPCDLS